jgi:hypothetical protein
VGLEHLTVIVAVIAGTPALPAVLRLRLGDRLPLHIRDRIGPSTRGHRMHGVRCAVQQRLGTV